MKVIIAGSRSITEYGIVKTAILNSCFEITEVVSGCCGGVDKLGEKWALKNKVSIKQFPALWHKYGKSAGYLRNKEMAKYADALISVWDGASPGTRHMINLAKEKKLKLYVSVDGRR